MKRTNALSIVIAAAFVGAVPVAAIAQGVAKSAVPPLDFQAKVQYCKTCHGLSGQGFHGAIPIPRLAGQQPEYFENQLGAFLERRRENKFMFGVVHALTPEMIAALSAHFHDLDAKPLGGAPKDLIAAGKKLYEEGAGTDVPACGTCHGADAKGTGPFPRLAGQLHDYVFNKLVNWSKERGQDPAKPDTSAIMEPIAHGLSQEQVKAVAAYLNYLD
jgi:cytochrome c553